MKKHFLAILALTSLASDPAAAGMLGNIVTATGSGQLLSGPTPSSTTVVDPGAEFSFCVGPAFNACVSSGMFSSINITNSSINFSFFGSTLPFASSFSIVLSGFTDPILGVSLGTSNSLFLGSFALGSFTSNSIIFTGTTTNGFNAINGRNYSCNRSPTFMQ